jgi:hypothetical protein
MHETLFQVEADLLDDAGWAEAVTGWYASPAVLVLKYLTSGTKISKIRAGCQYIFHVASPFPIQVFSLFSAYFFFQQQKCKSKYHLFFKSPIFCIRLG